ncbi:hypothetical protein Clacol_007428 [Clathrus columnatus]|uniref:Vacuolar protein sorting-associated protein 45 n=1 Tax=Clathrus columnatus TaxID=1419009 RepID=A0AAV5AHG1_9AGAM|nr:hypothetical protein Clacol_007428 [Clathrus columnatus]
MDVAKAIETYITKMVSEPPGIKVLLLDNYTTPIVSLATTQSILLSHQIYLTDRIDNKKRDRMAHMKCICFLRPVPESLEALAEELKEPNNVLTKVAIERLAEVDEYEVVQELQEYFADYAPLLPSLFSLNHFPSSSHPLWGSSPHSWNEAALERSVQGIISVLLSIRKKPLIRYERMSPLSKRLGAEVLNRIQTESALFEFRSAQVPPLLLILDRRNDPVTPLLSQWTYQAMVHELLNIQNGRVDLSLVPEIRPELKEITLTLQTDPFFAANHLSTFGDLGTSLKTYVQSYQSKSISPSAINSIADMKRFVEEFPEFRKLGGNVSKHVALVGELSRLVQRDHLLDIGEVEQGLATAAGADLKNVQNLLINSSIPAANKLRLVILYALRYQKTASSNITSLVDLLVEQGLTREETRLVYVFLNLAGSDQRQDDLFSNESLLAKGRSALKGLKGVENVYTQHVPHLSQTLENLIRGRLKEHSYPFIEGQSGINPNTLLQRPQDVIVFMIGGTTYEEARTVAMLNQDPNSSTTSPRSTPAPTVGTRILLGVRPPAILIGISFLEMMASAAAQFPSSVYNPPLETSTSSAPAINLQLGNINVNLGGPTPGVYRSTSEGGVSVQAEGIRGGVRHLFGKVKQGVDRMGLQ